MRPSQHERRTQTSNAHIEKQLMEYKQIPCQQRNMELLATQKFKCSVSSVLNKDTKQHGKQFLYDQEDDTAWSSNEGSPQWICIEFEELQSVSAFSFQFQGGFASKDAHIEIQSVDNDVLGEKFLEPFYADDINAVQNFKLSETQTFVKRIKFVFKTSTDFYNRIIVYNLKIFN